jgi:branched-chain amino acid transport system permease protein
MNEELAQALGINTRLVRFITFCLGAGLTSLGGALITPLVSVHPNLGGPRARKPHDRHPVRDHPSIP